ncbi:MAG: hypothetical protein JW942_06180 [Opitutales bacterium]|nr:hypothetical protein [Opitutales bacterium]
MRKNISDGIAKFTKLWRKNSFPNKKESNSGQSHVLSALLKNGGQTQI